MSEWISVMDRLPLDEQIVVASMFYKGKRQLRLVAYNKDEWAKIQKRGGIITHWLFIPAMPRMMDFSIEDIVLRAKGGTLYRKSGTDIERI